MNAVYQLRITLKNIPPPIWRQVQVPRDFHLDQLHTLIQLVMGWSDSHLHEFGLSRNNSRCQTQERRFVPVVELDEYFDDDDVEDERKVTIGELCPQVGGKLAYVYDFGDHWVHEVKVQKILTAKPGENYPLCLKGRRNCPPEDCGGIWGYENLLVVLSDPDHEEYEDLREWVGEDFDPEAFDLAAAVRAVREMKWK